MPTKRKRVSNRAEAGEEGKDVFTDLEDADADMELEKGDEEPKLEYPHGGVVRIKMRNFLTYDDVEFRPGPRVNLLIGPNGTGKSSVVCAICLGLGGKPSLLGRAKKIESFVRHGCDDDAEVEVELRNAKGGKNWVIFRSWNRDGKSSWRLNGKATTGKAIVDLVRGKLRIQLDNLCQFLPQDKVQEFSQMDAQELLAVCFLRSPSKPPETNLPNPNLPPTPVPPSVRPPCVRVSRPNLSPVSPVRLLSLVFSRNTTYFMQLMPVMFCSNLCLCLCLCLCAGHAASRGRELERAARPADRAEQGPRVRRAQDPSPAGEKIEAE